ncbi:V-set domain-containing T-cell activation inhibitor 1 isoform X2 [Echeneis naucrates]|uniref:V-set domain-containing T-cell activation inhibitor 1-like n=1 Tax=Echeneis naucrates TaxID=173247 RepID=A0A665THG4_ECHNA|nr:V-set domain-containing T-cell activation inhibitor 1-like isoform X2 [Echeneis naucrates]
MNMASIGTLFFILTIALTVGKGEPAFVTIHCKAETVGQYGRQSLLQCTVKSIENDTRIRTISWWKTGADNATLVFDKKMTTGRLGYKFAEPRWHDRNMNVSMLITNTQLSDAGHYECEVITDSGDCKGDLTLTVTAKYSAATIHPKDDKITRNTDGELMCKSDDGYPKGQIMWFVDDKTDWTAGAEMKAEEMANGFFRLTSKLTLLRGSIFDKYTCVVLNAKGDKEAEASYDVKAQTAEREDVNRAGLGFESSSKIIAPVVVIGSLIIGLLLALLIYKRRTRSNHEEVGRYEPETEDPMVRACQSQI